MSGYSEGGEPTRERVRTTIGLVGGYWRPLAAVARLLEELGELAELDRSDTLYASELADLWIITTALSDQFLGAVAEPGSHPPSGAGADPLSGEVRWVACDPLGSLLAAAGQIARIVNYYDGPKAPRDFDGWISLSDAVAEFHRALSDAAQAHDIDLADAVAAKLHAIPALDSGRFASGAHDPSTAASLERFRSLRPPDARLDADGSSERIEVENVRLWGSRERLSHDFSSCLDSIAADLVSFTKAAPWERFDGYVVYGPPLDSPALFDAWLARLLGGLLDRDPVGQQANGLCEGPERRFSFNGLYLVASGFCSLYKSSDPNPSPAGTLLLIQVEQTPEIHRAQ